VKQVLIRRGTAIVEEVPAPGVELGTVIVRALYSCISTGTELSGILASATPLWKRALRKPAHLTKAVDLVLAHGVRRAAEIVREKLDASVPTGYSLSGVVTEVAPDVTDIEVGDRVACAGAQCAYHAEYVCVPRNLVAPLPGGLDIAQASTVTLGAIALQGIRRAEPTLGETFVVIGLGVLGQLTVQILKVNGCRVAAIDVDRSRIEQAIRYGADFGIQPEDSDQVEQVLRATGGIGADGVIVTASTSSDAVIAAAFSMCRRKARVVLVGDVGLNINRADMYQKELDLRMSTSYGPGRYDARYEEHGFDYPIAYVRWTENRNMVEYLRLLHEGRVRVEEITSLRCSLDEVTDAYARLQSPDDRPFLALIQYPDPPVSVPSRTLTRQHAARVPVGGKIRVAIIGAGSFARAVHLPNLRSLSDRYQIRAIVSRTGHNAAEVARQFDAVYASTDVVKALSDPETDAVIIATRHNLHADLAIAALNAGKHVLLEKPTATTPEQLDRLDEFLTARRDDPTTPILLTGYNRRFSPLARQLREQLVTRQNPMIINYRMNAGYVPLDHWIHGPEGGGRNVGEACHLYDLFVFLTGSRATEVSARSISPATTYYGRSDNFVATMRFAEGSVANLVYCALGSSQYPKEACEIFVDGKVFALNDYVSLQSFGARPKISSLPAQDKGQRAELEAFAATITSGGKPPINAWEQLEVMRIAFDVQRQISGPS
jgi:predicted dehydrogenase